MKPFFTFFLAVVIGVLGSDVLAQDLPQKGVSSEQRCDATAQIKNNGYRKSLDTVMALDEIKDIAAMPGTKIHFGGEAIDGQQLFKGQCYWSVTVYVESNQETHRWKTYLVSPKNKKIYFLDDVTGDLNPLPLRRKK